MRFSTFPRPTPPHDAELTLWHRKNKATEYHLGLLKGKLARLRAQLLEPGPGEKSGGAGSGFDVSKSGGNIPLIRLPPPLPRPPSPPPSPPSPPPPTY